MPCNIILPGANNIKIAADAYFEKVEDISPEYLAAHTIRGIILDIDNTIVADSKTEVSRTVCEWLKNTGLPVCLLSNGKEQRVKQFADTFKLCYVSKANKPFKKGYVKAAELLGIRDLRKLAVIGDQLFSDILGGNTAGCYTIKVKPVDISADPLSVKIKRWFERFAV